MEPAIESKVMHGHPVRTKIVERSSLTLQFIAPGGYTRAPGVPEAITGETHGSK
jgi:hypothetical protein